MVPAGVAPLTSLNDGCDLTQKWKLETLSCPKLLVAEYFISVTEIKLGQCPTLAEGHLRSHQLSEASYLADCMFQGLLMSACQWRVFVKS